MLGLPCAFRQIGTSSIDPRQIQPANS